MRRWRLLVAFTALTAFAVAGCVARPSGTDGDLVNGWPAISGAAFDIPVVGSCYDIDTARLFQPWTHNDVPIPCTSAHEVEVVGTATVTGAAAASSTVPVLGGDDYRAARTACSTVADTYLGGDWHDARVYLRVEFPPDAAWSQGNRTIACQLGTDETRQFTDKRSSSLRNGLTGARQAARGCTNSDGTTIDSAGVYTDIHVLLPVSCDTPHDSEFVGAFDAADTPYPSDPSVSPATSRHCDALAAAFLGETAAALHQRPDLSGGWLWPGSTRWSTGDRSVYCYLFTTHKQKIATSLHHHA